LADKLDILINNAGVGATIPIAQVTEEDFDRLVNIHFKGVYFLTQKLYLILTTKDASLIFLVARLGLPILATRFTLQPKVPSKLSPVIWQKKWELEELLSMCWLLELLKLILTGQQFAATHKSKATLLPKLLWAESDRLKILAELWLLCSSDAKWINGQRIEASGGVFL
jgi:NAD(P)-dependent dehydrogenase (short-subunit alcohol dehydrogenase family)